jgi:hypothetical protein
MKYLEHAGWEISIYQENVLFNYLKRMLLTQYFIPLMYWNEAQLYFSVIINSNRMKVTCLPRSFDI